MDRLSADRSLAMPPRRLPNTTDDEKLDFETSEDVEIVPSFDTMGLKDELLRGIYAYGRPHRLLLRSPQCQRWPVGPSGAR